MQQRAVEVPKATSYDAWGLGWMHFRAGAQKVFGHDGGVAGSTAFLRIAPEHRLAISLLVNGPDYRSVYDAVMKPLLSTLAGVDRFPTVPPADPGARIDPEAYCGVYRRTGLDLRIWRDGERLLALPGGDYGDPNAQAFEIRPSSRDEFSARLPQQGAEIALYFLKFDSSGRPGYVNFMERAFQRTDV
jgi:hypothetical protein